MDYKIFFREFFTHLWNIVGKPLLKLIVIGGFIVIGAHILVMITCANNIMNWMLIGCSSIATIALLITFIFFVYQEVYKPAKFKAVNIKLQPLFELRASQMLFSLTLIWPAVGLYQNKLLPELIDIAKHYYFNRKYKNSTIEVCKSSVLDVLVKAGLCTDKNSIRNSFDLILQTDSYGKDEYLIAKVKEI